MIKALAIRKIGKFYDMPHYNMVFLPTGADVLLEQILLEMDVKDIDGYPIEIVGEHLLALAQAIIPIIGWYYYIVWLVRYRVLLYKYVIPLYSSSLNDWLRLLYSIFPIIFYMVVLFQKED